MTRGRKPKPNAQRRGGATPLPVTAIVGAGGAAEIIPAPSIEKPAHVAANAIQSECWDVLVGTGPGYEPCDVPLLESYCYWYAVLRQAEANTLDPAGGVRLNVVSVDADGNEVVLGANPDVRAAERATNMLRQLGDALQVNPAARDRAKLMDAVTKSTQADVVKKTMDGYEQFKRQQRALNASK